MDIPDDPKVLRLPSWENNTSKRDIEVRENDHATASGDGSTCEDLGPSRRSCLSCNRSKEYKTYKFPWKYRPREKERIRHGAVDLDTDLLLNFCEYCYNYITHNGSKIPVLVGWDEWDAIDCLNMPQLKSPSSDEEDDF